MKIKHTRHKLTVKTRLEQYSKPVESGCIMWVGGLDDHNYGKIRVDGKDVKAHRAAYEAYVGLIPPGAKVLHTCDEPSCINPEHLVLGTQLENMHDMLRKGRQRIANGKLSDDDVLSIFQSTETTKTLSEKYGVHKTVVQKIRAGRLHAWLTLGKKNGTS